MDSTWRCVGCQRRTELSATSVRLVVAGEKRCVCMDCNVVPDFRNVEDDVLGAAWGLTRSGWKAMDDLAGGVIGRDFVKVVSAVIFIDQPALRCVNDCSRAGLDTQQQEVLEHKYGGLPSTHFTEWCSELGIEVSDVVQLPGFDPNALLPRQTSD